MNINLKGQNIELTPAISEYAEKKIGTIEKYFTEGAMPMVYVEVGKSSAHHKHGSVFRAEVKVNGGGSDFYAVAEAEDLYAAIDLVRAEIINEITHAKSKQRKLFRKGARALKDIVRGFFPKNKS